MKAKVGDICVVKPTRDGSYCDWTGLLVEVLGPMQTEMKYPDVPYLVNHKDSVSLEEWFCRIVGGVKTPLQNDEGLNIFTSYGRMWDHRLRPFRGQEGQDETLSWKDVPQGEIA